MATKLCFIILEGIDKSKDAKNMSFSLTPHMDCEISALSFHKLIGI